MERMLVVVFDSQSGAYEGCRALQQLDFEGEIAIEAMAVVYKGMDGKLSVRDAADAGPGGTATGALAGTALGALIVALGGPTGVILGGAATGTIIGGIVDLNHAGVGMDFVGEAGQALEPGTSAVVADVLEEWVTPVDTRMAQLGGMVFRRSRVEVEDAQFERDVMALDADIAAMEAETEQATAEIKGKIQAKIDELKAKRQAAIDRAKAKAEEVRRQGEAKVKALQEKIKTTKAERQPQQQERIAKVRANYEARVQKFKESFKH